MAKRQMILFAIALFVLAGCASHCRPGDITAGKYNGYALVLFYEPVSGSAYEAHIIPICKPQQDSGFNPDDLDFASISESEGVGANIYRGGPYQPLFDKALKVQLKGRDSVARELQTVYMCRVEVDFSGVENDTPKPNSSGADFFKEKLILKDGRTLSIRYFFSHSIDVHSLKVL